MKFHCLVLAYIKARLEETSTKTAILAGIAAAAALSSPWSFVSIGVCVLFAIIPTSDKRDAE